MTETPTDKPASAGANRAKPVTSAPGAASQQGLGASAPQRMVKCPKCGTDVREIARFCQRCHHTMRYECPACKHQQREGGKCEKCGVDFLKYITAVVSQKQAEADVYHERLEHRSNFMKNLMWLPVTFGFPIIRDYFVKRDRRK